MARILVIDDDAQFRTMLQKRLEREGYEVETAFDGRDGIDLYKAHPADLVITDFQMPRKNGREVIEELTAEYPDVRIVVLTGFTGEAFAKISSLGVDRIFLKPPNFSEFLGAVEEHLAE